MLDPMTREAKERLLRPIAAAMTGTHPGLITAASLVFGLTSFGLAWGQFYLLALLFWWLNRFTDGLDGTVARLTGRQSDLGGYLDILSDFLVYALVPIGLVLADLAVGRLVALVLMLAIYYINAASWMYLAAILEKRRQGTQRRGEMTSVTNEP